MLAARANSQARKGPVPQDVQNHGLLLALPPFPWERVRNTSGTLIAEWIHVFERSDMGHPPHDSRVNALNTILVWGGARTAALPAWNQRPQILELISFFNRIRDQLPKHSGAANVEELTFLQPTLGVSSRPHC